MNKKIKFILVDLILIIVLCRVIFYIPDKKYDYILNSQNYYIFSCLLILLGSTIFYLILRKYPPIKRILSMAILTIVIFICTGTYFYTNLPQYTYAKAAKKIEEPESDNKELKKLYIPTHLEDKVGKIKCSFLQINHSIYYIYFINNDDQIVAYRFDPISGDYKFKTNNK